ncbi:MAG TPA: TetR/AcrR family transcriptional regulator [Nonomuraea sp.]|nr:TetR/AcrR family transcriptional regulator [Nonomuraea sp.]
MPGGRPRAFDPDAALDGALEVFWSQGYEGAAISDLTAAMGINRPSLYAAFGNKEELFRKVLERYMRGPGAFAARALRAPRARDVVEGLLYGAVELTTGPGTPRGCLSVACVQACGPEAEPVRQEVAARRKAGEAALRARLERARDEGDLPGDCDPADLARLVTALTDGIAVAAAGGSGRQELLRLAATALRIWPSRPD